MLDGIAEMFHELAGAERKRKAEGRIVPWEKAHPDRARESRRRYRAKNLEKRRAWDRKHQAARRARLRAARLAT